MALDARAPFFIFPLASYPNFTTQLPRFVALTNLLADVYSTQHSHPLTQKHCKPKILAQTGECWNLWLFFPKRTFKKRPIEGHLQSRKYEISKISRQQDNQAKQDN